MAITRDEVRRVAALARLALDDDEVARFRDDLEAILVHVDRLGELELADDLAPLNLAGESTAFDVDGGGRLRSERTRADRPDAALERERVLGNAPDRDDDVFLVPRAVQR